MLFARSDWSPPFFLADCALAIKYTDAALYNQLLYYKSLFDGQKAVASAKGTVRHGQSFSLNAQCRTS